MSKRPLDQKSPVRKRSSLKRPATNQTLQIPANTEATMHDSGNASSSSNPLMIKECHVESKVKEYHVGDKELKLHPTEKEYEKLAVEKPSAKMRKTEEAFVLNEIQIVMEIWIS